MTSIRSACCSALIAFAASIVAVSAGATTQMDTPVIQTASVPIAVQFDNLPGYDAAQTRIANKIARRFAAAGYGQVHQIAAVSVAIRESTLNPNAVNRGCKCYGLFQLNRAAGLGRGHSVSSLVNAENNIRLIIGEANRFVRFRDAKTVDTAVEAFVRNVTRPARKSSVVRATIRTARMVEKAAIARPAATAD